MLELLAKNAVLGEPGPAQVASRAFNTARARAVIQKAIEISDWKTKPSQPGRGKGFAFYFCHRGYFAVVDLSVSDEKFTVHKIWAAGDVGSHIINPSGAESQVKGSIIVIEIAWVLSDFPVSGLGEPALPPVIPA